MAAVAARISGVDGRLLLFQTLVIRWHLGTVASSAPRQAAAEVGTS